MSDPIYLLSIFGVNEIDVDQFPIVEPFCTD